MLNWRLIDRLMLGKIYIERETLGQKYRYQT